MCQGCPTTSSGSATERRGIDKGDFAAAARAAFEALLTLQQEQNDMDGMVLQMVHVAWVQRMGQQEFAAARRLLDEALALAADLPVSGKRQVSDRTGASGGGGLGETSGRGG